MSQIIYERKAGTKLEPGDLPLGVKHKKYGQFALPDVSTGQVKWYIWCHKVGLKLTSSRSGK